MNMCICTQTRLSCVSVAWPCYSNKSHCSPHSSQQCVHMLLSTTRPLCCCGVHWEKFKMYPKGCGWDNRGPCSPAAAALLPAWRWGAQGLLMETSLRFQKDFFFPCSTQLDRRKYKHNTRVCVYYSIWNRFWTVHKAPIVCVVQVASGESLALFSSPPDPTRVSATPQKSSVCDYVYTLWKSVYGGSGGKTVTWSGYVTQSQAQFAPYAPCYPGLLLSLGYNNGLPFKNTSTMCVRHVVKPSPVRGYHPWEWRRGDLSSEPGSVLMKAAGLWGKFLHPSSSSYSILLSLPA